MFHSPCSTPQASVSLEINLGLVPVSTSDKAGPRPATADHRQPRRATAGRRRQWRDMANQGPQGWNGQQWPALAGTGRDDHCPAPDGPPASHCGRRPGCAPPKLPQSQSKTHSRSRGAATRHDPFIRCPRATPLGLLPPTPEHAPETAQLLSKGLVLVRGFDFYGRM